MAKCLITSAATVIGFSILLAGSAPGEMKRDLRVPRQVAASSGDTTLGAWQPSERMINVFEMHRAGGPKPHLDDPEKYASDLQLVLEGLELSGASLTNDTLPQLAAIRHATELGTPLRSADSFAVFPGESNAQPWTVLDTQERLVAFHALRGRRRWCNTPAQFVICNHWEPRDAPSTPTEDSSNSRPDQRGHPGGKTRGRWSLRTHTVPDGGSTEFGTSSRLGPGSAWRMCTCKM